MVYDVFLLFFQGFSALESTTSHLDKTEFVTAYSVFLPSYENRNIWLKLSKYISTVGSATSHCLGMELSVSPVDCLPKAKTKRKCGEQGRLSNDREDSRLLRT